MLPPVDSGVLVANPKFDALYCDLCTNKLDIDGASRLDAKALKESEDVISVSGYFSCLLSANCTFVDKRCHALRRRPIA